MAYRLTCAAFASALLAVASSAGAGEFRKDSRQDFREERHQNSREERHDDYREERREDSREKRHDEDCREDSRGERREEDSRKEHRADRATCRQECFALPNGRTRARCLQGCLHEPPGREPSATPASRPTATPTFTGTPTSTHTPTATPSPTSTSIPCVSYADLVLSHSPAVYYRLGEASGPTALDEGVNGRVGSYQNTAALLFGEPGALARDPDTAVVSTGGFMSIGDSPVLDPGQLADGEAMTWEGWYRTAPGVFGSFPLWNRWSSAGNQMITQLARNELGQAMCFTRLGSQVLSAVSTTEDLNDGDWHHIVCRYDGTTTGDGLSIFVNGVRESSTTTPATTFPAIAGPAQIWGFSDGNASSRPTASAPFWADEVAYYQSALTDAEVAAHYDAGIIGCLSGADDGADDP